MTVFEKIRQWATERGLYESGDIKTQFCKLSEEMGEMAEAILKQNNEEFKDAVGDMVVVLTNLSKLNNMNIEDCIESAYEEIKNRKGKMINNTFVKESELPKVESKEFKPPYGMSSSAALGNAETWDKYGKW